MKMFELLTKQGPTPVFWRANYAACMYNSPYQVPQRKFAGTLLRGRLYLWNAR